MFPIYVVILLRRKSRGMDSQGPAGRRRGVEARIGIGLNSVSSLHYCPYLGQVGKRGNQGSFCFLVSFHSTKSPGENQMKKTVPKSSGD